MQNICKAYVPNIHVYKIYIKLFLLSMWDSKPTNSHHIHQTKSLTNYLEKQPLAYEALCDLKISSKFPQIQQYNF